MHSSGTSDGSWHMINSSESRQNVSLGRTGSVEGDGIPAVYPTSPLLTYKRKTIFVLKVKVKANIGVLVFTSPVVK